MSEQNRTDFLRRRMTQLREKNGYSLTRLANEKSIAPSILSRAEKIGGSTGFKTVDHYARKYCEWFHLNDQQTENFLRGEKAVVVDISALINRKSILDELCEEYSYVVVPSFVVDDLGNIENENPNEFGSMASKLLRDIFEDERIYTRSYSIPTESEVMIVDIANAISNEFGCFVDIITYDYKTALHVGGCVKEDSAFQLLYLSDYVAAKQSLVNMSMLNAVNDYYADSYVNANNVLGITLPKKGDPGFYLDAYLTDGTTLIISAVNNFQIPVEQRKEKIRWLIENGADIDRRDCGDEYLPPISHSIRNRDYEMFSFLYHECHANPNIGSRYPYYGGKRRYKNNGNTPLMIAAWNNQEKIVRDLCADERVSLNQQDSKNGFTALIKACYWGYKGCRRIIENAGADVNILDHTGLSAQDRWIECLEKHRYMERGK